MKKFLAFLIMAIFIGTQVQAATITSAIKKYKNGNYTGCINELDELVSSMNKEKSAKAYNKEVIAVVSKYDTKKIMNGDITEAKKVLEDLYKEVGLYKGLISKYSYIYYYYALSNHRLFYTDEKKEDIILLYLSAYVMAPKSKIAEYSLKAVGCIVDETKCEESDIDDFVRSGQQVSDEIILNELQKDLEKHKKRINNGEDLVSFLRREDTVTWADSGITSDVADVVTQQENSIPSDEEIGRAFKVLQRAGFNQMPYGNMPMNNDYMQLNAFLNGNNSNNNDYSTMMMFNNGNGQISPQVMQTIMQQQMMGGFGSF